MVKSTSLEVTASDSENSRAAEICRLYVQINKQISEDNQLRIQAHRLLVQANSLLAEANRLSIENYGLPRLELRAERDKLRAQAFEFLREAMRIKARIVIG
jgi:hypothetical protein